MDGTHLVNLRRMSADTWNRLLLLLCPEMLNLILKQVQNDLGLLPPYIHQ